MILIADDSRENIISLKKVLEKNNFEVDTVSSGEEALKKVLKRSYILIILDVVVLQLKPASDDTLTSILSSKTKLPVKELKEKEVIMPSTIYIEPSDYHLLIENDKTFSLDASEKVNFSRPSIDVIFQSAAEVYKENLVCLLLSGSNNKALMD